MCISKKLFKMTFDPPRVHIDNEKMDKRFIVVMKPTFDALVSKGVSLYDKMTAIPHQEFHINSFDGTILYLDYFDNKSDTTIIFAHGYNSKRGMGDYSYLGYQSYQRGYNVLFFDQRHCGLSNGNYITFGAYEHKDLLEILKYYNQNYKVKNIFLHGTSLGGATVLLCSKYEIDNLKGIISDCPYKDALEEIKYIGQKIYFKHVPNFIINNLHKQCIKHGFSLNDNKPIDFAKEAKCPIMLMHGTSDNFIPYQNSLDIYDVIPTEKEIHLYEGIGHGASIVADNYLDDLYNFIDKYKK